MHDVMTTLSHIARLHFLQINVGHLRLGVKELVLLQILVEAGGRVVSRTELRRRAALSSDRRCDDLLVNVRRVIGADAVQNVRRRGWRLDPSALKTDAAGALVPDG